MTKALVIARWNEDLTWALHEVFRGFRVYIYDKATRNQQFFIPDAEVIRMKNVGRDYSAYFLYLTEHHGRYEDMVYLLQGDPLEQCPDLFERIAGHDSDYLELNSWETECDGAGAPHHFGLPVASFYEQVFGKAFPGKIEFNPSSMYGVSSERLMARSKEFYYRLYDFTITNEQAPWLCERVMRHILKGLS